MNHISQTLNCKNICSNRIKNNLPVYDGGLGSNYVQQPDFFTNSLKKFAEKKDYVSVHGIDELQETIKKKFSNKNYLVDSVVVGNGLKELLFLLQLSFTSMSNGIIFHITPSWVSYKEQILILEKNDKLKEINTTFENKYKVTPEQLDEELSKFSDENKLIIFNNPNNPTGIIYSPEEVKEISSILKKHNCVVLSDEIYFNLNHDNSIVSISEFIPELTIIGSSVSKDMGCGGYRVGWLTFPKSLKLLSDKCASNGSSIYSCAPTPLQYATNEMLNNNEEFKKHCKLNNLIYKFVAQKTDSILSKSKLKYVPTESSWYVFLDFSNYKKYFYEKGIYSSIQLCNYLIETIGLISVAGKHFNTDSLSIRVSLVGIDTESIDYLNCKFDKENIFKHMEEGFNKLVDLLKKIENYNN